MKTLTRRQFLEWGAMCGAGIAYGEIILNNRALAALPLDTQCGIQEAMPTSPFIVTPFADTPENQLPILQAMAPGWRPDPTLPAGQESKISGTARNYRTRRCSPWPGFE